MQARLIACLLPLLLAAAQAAAQERTCRSFSWSVGRSIDLFDEPLPVVQDSQSLPKEGAFGVTLKPVGDVIYPVAPERGRDGGNGGVITIESLPAGRYQIALSAEAWVDAIQDNKHLKALPPTRTEHCPGVRRSIEVEVKGEPLTLQFSGATERRINVAVLRLWPFEWRW